MHYALIRLYVLCGVISAVSEQHLNIQFLTLLAAAPSFTLHFVSARLLAYTRGAFVTLFRNKTVSVDSMSRTDSIGIW